MISTELGIRILLLRLTIRLYSNLLHLILSTLLPPACLYDLLVVLLSSLALVLR